jgi:DNA-directed RNA polymerase II subunit RPB1
VWHSKTTFPDLVTKAEACTLFEPKRALDILTSIDDDVYARLGYTQLKYTHPKSYIFDVISVSSLASRCVTTRGRGASSSSRSLDDLTALYQLVLNSVSELKRHRDMIAQREALGDDNLAMIRKLKLTKDKIDRARYMVNRIPEDIQVRVCMLFVKDLRTQTAKSRKLYSKTGGPPPGMPVHGPSRSSQPAASFTSVNDRITGNNKKRTLVRGNLMGKRLEFTARTVITPDPTLKINELGVPLEIATDQTYKSMVTRYNIEWLCALVIKGANAHPGAVAVWKLKRRPGTTTSKLSVSGSTESLENRERICLRQTSRRYRATHIRLRIGDIVERYMIDGDIVLFNRQPSLHKNSFMAHLAKIWKKKTFGMNSCVCKSYNADHDGDEMNMHFPQTEDARSDAANLLLVDHNICTPQTGFPVVTVIQDMVDVMFRLGTMDTLLPHALMCDMAMTLLFENDCGDIALDEPAIWVKPGLMPSNIPGWNYNRDKSSGASFAQFWTGAQLAARVMPPCLNLTHRKKNFLLCRQDWNDPILDGAETCIRHGRVCAGWLTKSVLNKITEQLFKTRGSKLCPSTQLSVAGQYLTRVSRLTYHYSARAPSTIGIRDVSIQDPDLELRIKQITSTAVNIISRNADALSEFEIGRLCQRIIKYVGDAIVKSQPKNCTRLNNNVRASVSGARGSITNIVQTMGCLGQQHVEGQRIGIFGPEGRSLPFFPRDTPKSNLTARGLIAFSCFLSGLSPKEFIFHMQGGREGIISTAIKTAQSGYITRRLTTVLKGSIKFGYVMLGDWFFAHKYYGDGLDASRLTLCTTPQLMDASARLLARYSPVMPPIYLAQLTSLHGAIAAVKGRTIAQNSTEPQLALFYDLKTYLADVYRQPICEDEPECSAWEQLDRIHADLRTVVADRIAAVQIFADLLALGDELLETRHFPERSKYKIVLQRKAAWDWLYIRCAEQAARAVCVNGEQIGNQGASALGERTTQLTLDTFHHAGHADAIGAGGLQRMNEVINVTDTSKMHHRAMHIQVPPSAAGCAQTGLKLQCTYLKDVAVSCVLELATCHEKQDAPAQRIFYARYVISGEFSNFYPPVQRNGVMASKRCSLPIDERVFRIVLDKQACQRRGIAIASLAHTVFHSLVKYFKKSPSRFSLIHSEPWMTAWVIRIRFVRDLGESLDPLWSPANSSALPGYRELARAVDRPAFQNLVVGGCDQLEQAFPATCTTLVWRAEARRLVTVEQPFVCTAGTDLAAVLRRSDIDPRFTWSNSVREVEINLGIMAAQQVVFNESRAVLMFNGGYISPRHLYLLSQTVTHHGFVCPVSRYGLAKSGASPLLRMSFEEGRSVMEQATRRSLVDECADITACIILGQKSDIGSGGVHVLPAQATQGQLSPEQTSLPRSDPLVGAALINKHSSGTDLFFQIVTIEARKKAWTAQQEWYRTRSEREQRDDEEAAQVQSFLTGEGVSSGGGGGGGSKDDPEAVQEYRPVSPPGLPESPEYRPTSPMCFGTDGSDDRPISPPGLPQSPDYRPSSPAYNPHFGGTFAFKPDKGAPRIDGLSDDDLSDAEDESAEPEENGSESSGTDDDEDEFSDESDDRDVWN